MDNVARSPMVERKNTFAHFSIIFYVSLAERLEGTRLLIWRGEIPIVGSNPTGNAHIVL